MMPGQIQMCLVKRAGPSFDANVMPFRKIYGRLPL